MLHLADSKSFSALMKKLGEEREDKNGYVEAFEEVSVRVARRGGRSEGLRTVAPNPKVKQTRPDINTEANTKTNPPKTHY